MNALERARLARDTARTSAMPISVRDFRRAHIQRCACTLDTRGHTRTVRDRECFARRELARATCARARVPSMDLGLLVARSRSNTLFLEQNPSRVSSTFKEQRWNAT